jgi:hypothetical protein
MKVDDLLVSDGIPDYYDPSFRATLEAHLSYLRTHPDTIAIEVPPFGTYLYNQDLFGYLQSIGQPMQMHWIIMRVNNFSGPFEFNENCEQLLIPPSKPIDILRQSWKTVPLVTT